MSAVVCGSKRSNLFEEAGVHPPIAKWSRCGSNSNSPVRLSLCRGGESSPSPSPCSVGFTDSPKSSTQSLITQLKALFPHMDDQLIEKVLESTGHNIDSAIKSLNELRLSSGREENILNSSRKDNSEAQILTDAAAQSGAVEAPSLESVNPEQIVDQQQQSQSEGTKWVELFVQEMLGACNLDNAKERAARALEAFEKSIMGRTGSLLEDLQKENFVLKEQLQIFVRDNLILKRAVAIQHERQAEHENRSQEINRLKELISQYQEQVRTLELNNYALTMHLRQAQEGSSIPGRFHPDVF